MACVPAAKKPLIPLSLDKSPDLLCLQEVKLNSEVIPDDDFGYPFRHYHLAEKKGYSGTAIFSKSEPLSIREDLPDPKHGGKAVESHSSLTAFIWLMCMCLIQRGTYPVCPTGTIPGILILGTMSSSSANRSQWCFAGI